MNNAIDLTATPAVDWGGLAASTAQYAIAGSSDGGRGALVCALRTKLTEPAALVSKLFGGPLKVAEFLRIYTDVFVIDEPFVHAQSTVIMARRITYPGAEVIPIMLPEPSTGPTVLQILCGSVEQGKLMIGYGSGDLQEIPVEGPGPFVLRVTRLPGQERQIETSREPAELRDLLRHPVSWNALKASFEAATLLTEDHAGHPEGLAMLAWVNAITAAIAPVDGPFRQEAADLCAQSAALLLISSTDNAAPYVPALSDSFYRDRMSGLLDVVGALEGRIGELAVRADVANAVKEVAAAMGDVAQTDTRPLRVLREITVQEADALRAEHGVLAEDLRKQERLINMRRIAFEQGVREHVLQEKLELIFKLVKAVGTLAVAVGGAVATGGAAAGGLGAVPGEVAEAAEGVSDILADENIYEGVAALMEGELLDVDVFASASTMDFVKSLVSDTSGLKDTLKALAGVGTAGKELFDIGSKTLKVFSKDHAPPDLSQSKWAEVASMDTDLQWNLFLNNINETLKKLVDKKVSGAQEYRAALRDLVEYGKAVNRKMVALARIQARAVELRAQEEAAVLAGARWRALREASGSDTEQHAALMALLAQRAINTKRSLLVSARAYAAAYRFRWLTDPRLRVSVRMNHAALLEAVAGIEAGVERLLTFSGPSQPYDTGYISIPVVALDESADRGGEAGEELDTGDLAELAAAADSFALLSEQDGMPVLSWTVPIDTPFLEGVSPRDGNLAFFVDEAWFYLVGARPNDRHRIILRAGTSGQFANGFGDNGARLVFSSAPGETRELDFIYAVDKANKRSDPSTGGVGTPWAPSEAVRSQFLAPSPFTTWRIRVMESGGLDDLRALRVRFRGHYHRVAP